MNDFSKENIREISMSALVSNLTPRYTNFKVILQLGGQEQNPLVQFNA